MSSNALKLDPDRLFPVDGAKRQIARRLYESVKSLPIISPHGHTDPKWFADNQSFTNASELILTPDHYVLRMLYSQGISLEQLGVKPRGGKASEDPRESWRLFAQNYYLFRGTPSHLWLNTVFFEIFGMTVKFNANTADLYYDTITEALQTEAFRPRSILDTFNVEFIATTEGATNTLSHHDKIIREGWGHRVVTTFRPDDVLDPDHHGFKNNIERIGDLTGHDSLSWTGYLAALRERRAYFKARGATATDHGHPSPATRNFSNTEAESLFQKCLAGDATASECEDFRGHMLTEMAKMSLDDGLVMQLHPGSCRNHNQALFEAFGADKGADIPKRVSYTEHLKPLLDVVGNDTNFKLILFTLDESNYARELAPLAGHYPCLLLGPPWWFHDSPEGMIRFRSQVTETAGFYNTAGFNDDTRALLSIPARHDLARRMDCRFLAELVSEGRIDQDDADEIIQDLSINLVRRAYKLPQSATAKVSAAE